ncbi:MAG TPA: hypothetical protein VIU64_22355 [Polyangia bacterium]
MAELCVRQGHRDEGLAIYRRLLGRAPDAAARERLGARVAHLESAPPQSEPPSAPRASQAASLDPPAGLRATIEGQGLIIDWRLPPAEPRPRELEVLLVKRTATGVTTETRSLSLDGQSGRLRLHATGLHSARAAAGYRREGRFIPILRAQAGPRTDSPL